MRCICSVTAALLVVLSFNSHLSAQQNQPPNVTLTPIPVISPGNTLVTLSALVTDDGLPMGSSLTYQWCKFDGPGPVVFGSPDQLQTTAQFDQAGTYDMRFTASDGVLETVESLTVTVMTVPNLPIVVTNILNSFANPSLDPIYADRFLTLVPNTSIINTTGAAYYAAVDPLGLKTTFDDFKVNNGFTPGNPSLVQSVGDSRSGCCTAGVYGNAGDLGFGRRMVMNRDGGDIAYYVTNYQTVHEALAEDPAGIILTVCMEYSATPGATSTTGRYVKFYMYDGAGNRITDVDFDGRGPKPVPSACAACHGGVYNTGGTIMPDGNMGAYFMPFDLDQFDFSCEPGTSREANEEPFREFNEAILYSDAPAVIKELIRGWYGGFNLPSPTQNPKWVPPGWRTEPELYRQVVAPSCRNCHLTRTSATLNFDHVNDFVARATDISGPIVFGPLPSGFMMPHAEATWERFWLSTTPHQPDILASAFSNGVFVGLGAPAGRVYVDAAAGGTGDGSSWTDAFTTLSGALAAASSATTTIDEIWVAAGTYLPDTTSLGNPREATFSIPDGVKIYGGFAAGDALLEDRVPGANVSLLSGDLNGDDLAVGRTDNAFHVVTMNQCSSATILDGFEIRGGNAVGGSDPRGGGVFITGGAPVLIRNNVVDNRGDAAGGMFIDGSGPTLLATSFYGNDGDTLAGGIWATNASNVRIENCIFSFNLAEGVDGDAGAILAEGGFLQLLNCTLYRNYSDRDGGGIILRAGADAEVVNSIFYRNCANGITDENAQVFVDNGLGVVTLQLDYSLVQGLTGMLGGAGNIDSDPQFVNADGVDGILGTLDDDLRLQDGSPAVDAGANDRVGSDTFDVDTDFNLGEKTPLDGSGMNRFFDSNLVADTGVGTGPIVDMGAIEMIDGSLLPCAAGNVRSDIDGPHDVVTVNGTNGGSSRLVYAGTGDNLVISVVPPPGQSFANFALFISLGIPGANDVFALDFGLGDMCFTPSPLLPFENGDFILTDNLGLGFGGAIGSTPAPWTMPPFVLGQDEADFVVQGIIWDNSKLIPLSVTNAVLVSVRENPPVNLEPQAVVADSSIQAFTSANVMLDGSLSFDPEGSALTYSWTQTSGTAVVINNADQAIADFVAPASPETLEFELVVSDAVNTSTATTVTVEIISDTPIADAGTNQSVITNAAVILDGSGSVDPQMQPINFQWMQTGGPAVTLNNANSATPSFTAPASSATLTFSLVVDDGVNFSTPDFVQVTVLTSFVNDVYPIFSTMVIDCDGFPKVCINCHTGAMPSGGLLLDQSAAGARTALLAGRVNLVTPTSSLVLLKPLAVSAGGVSHGGGNIWCDTMDPNYVTILNWIMEGGQDN